MARSNKSRTDYNGFILYLKDKYNATFEELKPEQEMALNCIYNYSSMTEYGSYERGYKPRGTFNLYRDHEHKFGLKKQSKKQIFKAMDELIDIGYVYIERTEQKEISYDLPNGKRQINIVEVEHLKFTHKGDERIAKAKRDGKKKQDTPVNSLF